MREYISEGRAMYEDENHGLFSRKLAAWAISKMRVIDPVEKEKRQLKARGLGDVQEILSSYGIDLMAEHIYTAWYLFNMALADYPKTLKTDEQRATFVEETICDPDGEPGAVLECFEAKMRMKGCPIQWERFL